MDRGKETDEREGYTKVNRVLSLYDSLNKGAVVNKKQAASKFCVSEKAIQRDLMTYGLIWKMRRFAGSRSSRLLITIALRKVIV